MHSSCALPRAKTGISTLHVMQRENSIHWNAIISFIACLSPFLLSPSIHGSSSESLFLYTLQKKKLELKDGEKKKQKNQGPAET